MTRMDTWSVTLARENARITYTIEGDDPHYPNEITTTVTGRPGMVYQEVQQRIELPPWSHLNLPGGREDAYWILDCVQTTAINHPGWQVETDLPALPGARTTRISSAGARAISSSRGRGRRSRNRSQGRFTDGPGATNQGLPQHPVRPGPFAFFRRPFTGRQ